MTCPRCDGTGIRAGGEPCDYEGCEGGQVGMDRCPASVCAGMAEFIDAWAAYQRGDGLPSEGHWRAQPAIWEELRVAAEAELARIKKAREGAAAEVSGALRGRG